MGCDIHMVVERKWGEKWVGLHAAPFMRTYSRENETAPLTMNFHGWDIKNRNYEFFAKLAGVRGKGPEPRGVPDDASELTLMEVDYYGQDGHSHSWSMAQEFYDLFRESNEWLVVNSLEGSVRVSIDDLLGVAYIDLEDEEEENAVDNYRVVFWFDN